MYLVGCVIQIFNNEKFLNHTFQEDKVHGYITKKSLILCKNQVRDVFFLLDDDEQHHPKKIRSSSPCCQPSSFSSRALFRVDQKFEKIVQGGIFKIRFVFLHTTAFFQCSSVENSFKKTYSKLHNFSIFNPPPPMGSSA